MNSLAVWRPARFPISTATFILASEMFILRAAQDQARGVKSEQDVQLMPLDIYPSLLSCLLGQALRVRDGTSPASLGAVGTAICQGMVPFNCIFIDAPPFMGRKLEGFSRALSMQLAGECGDEMGATPRPWWDGGGVFQHRDVAKAAGQAS